MRRTRLATSLVLVGSLGFLAGTGVSQDPGDDPEPLDMEALMKMQMEMMRLSTPGPEHEALAAGQGEWDLETSLYSPPVPGMPEMPPMEAGGTTTSEMVLGGRWMMSTNTGTMMGQKVESIGFVGYDRRHEEYVTVGLDSMGTYFITAKGPRDEDGLIRMHGTDDDGFGGQDYFIQIDDSDPDRMVTNIYWTKMAGIEVDPPFRMVGVVQTRRTGG